MKSAKQGEAPMGRTLDITAVSQFERNQWKMKPENNSGTAAIPLIAGIVAQESRTEEVT
jgi:hypothetical protein